MFKKSVLQLEIPFCLLFFTKNKVIPLIFSTIQILIKIHYTYDIRVRFMQFLPADRIVKLVSKDAYFLWKKPKCWKIKKCLFSMSLSVIEQYLWSVNQSSVFKNTLVNRSFWLKSRKWLCSMGVLWHNLGGGAARIITQRFPNSEGLDI